MKRTRIKPKHRTAAQRNVDAERRAAKRETGRCMICQDSPATDCHEISRGCHRAKAYQERASWLLVCRSCHEALDDPQHWPIARQLAVKYLRDPEYYDRVAVNLLRGRQPEAITEAEVMEQVGYLEALGF